MNPGSPENSGEDKKPCRLAKHTLADGSSHYDLFIDTESESLLVTIEIHFNKSDLKMLFDFLDSSGKYGSFISRIDFSADFFPDESVDPGNFLTLKVRGCRKQDHRRLYMKYTGEISGGRGSLFDLASGYYSGPIPGFGGDFELVARIAGESNRFGR